MIARFIAITAFLFLVCPHVRARENGFAPAIFGIDLPPRHVPLIGGRQNHVSGNVDGIYTGGAQLLLFGNDGSFKWGREIPCRIRDIHALPEGGVVTTGDCARKTGRKIVAVGPSVLRFDARGNLVWARTIVVGRNTNLRKLSADGAGDIYVAGYLARKRKRRYPNKGIMSHLDAFIVRLNAGGEVGWARAFKSERYSRGTEITALAAMPGGRIAMTVADRLAILDPLGKPAGAHRLRMNGAPLELRYMARAGGDLVLSGRIINNDARGIDVWAASWDPAGRVGWAVRLDAGASDLVWAVAASPDATATIAGSTQRMGRRLEDKVHRRDGWIVRLGQDGAITGSFTVGYDGDDYLGAATGDDDILAVTGGIDDGGTVRRFLAIAPDVPSNAGRCRAVKKAPVKVHRLEIESVPSEVSLEDIRITGSRFDPEISAVPPRLQDLCNGSPRSRSR